jgi:hypothetical protein
MDENPLGRSGRRPQNALRKRRREVTVNAPALRAIHSSSGENGSRPKTVDAGANRNIAVSLDLIGAVGEEFAGLHQLEALAKSAVRTSGAIRQTTTSKPDSAIKTGPKPVRSAVNPIAEGASNMPE